MIFYNFIYLKFIYFIFFLFKIVLLVNKNGLKIELEGKKINTQLKFKAQFSNQSTAPMENITLSLAAPRVSIIYVYIF